MPIQRIFSSSTVLDAVVSLGTTDYRIMVTVITPDPAPAIYVDIIPVQHPQTGKTRMVVQDGLVTTLTGDTFL